MVWMVVRVRGTIHARRDIVATLAHLNLTRPNHATIVPEVPTTRGMLVKVQGYVTWGEADAATVGDVLKARGQTVEGRPLAAEPTLADVSRSVAAGGFGAAAGVKPLVRLRAPKGGWRSTKKPFARGGALGYRGAQINELVRRML